MPAEIPAWVIYPEACEAVAHARGARHRGPVTKAVLPRCAAFWNDDERSLWLEVFVAAARGAELEALRARYREALLAADRAPARSRAAARLELDDARAALLVAEEVRRAG